EECETAKRSLVTTEQARIRIPTDKGEFADNPDFLELTREELHQVTDPLVKRLARPLSRALRDAKITPEEIAEVVLVGGATRGLEVQHFVEEFFGKPAHAQFNPDEVVALGAAVQAALITDEAAVSDMVMTDICPFTLGIMGAKDFGQREVSGYFLPVI